MRVLMGILKNKHGVYYVRKKVPKGLEQAVARAIGSPQPSLSWLKRSLRTKDAREANVLAKPVLIEFDRILEQAARSLEAKPLRTELSEQEIARLSSYYFASLLEEDEASRLDDLGEEEMFQRISRELEEVGEAASSPFASSVKPSFGLSERQLYRKQESVDGVLPAARRALSKGDLSFVQDELDELLAACGINLDKASPSYRQLGYAFLKRQVEYLEAVDRRNRGEVVETPPLSDPVQKQWQEATIGSGSLSDAMEGWKKARQPGPNVISEYAYAIRRFAELHGDMEIINIKRSHVREFREALQAMPVRRTGQLRWATLPQLVEWSKKNPDAPRIASATVNKLLGGVQAIAVWGYDNGLTPDDVAWSDPFARMRLEEDEPDREPWELAELQLLFTSPVFAIGDRPKGGCGEAAYWLPLLGLYTGARLGELAPLSASDVVTDEETGIPYIAVTEDQERGTRLKTASSRRAIPLHPELIKLGFLSVVDEVRSQDEKAALFPLLKPGSRGGYAEAWSKWFGRYIRSVGIRNKSRVFHSFRHGFKDALRAAGEAEDINDALTGHSGGGVGRSYGAREMIRRFGLPRLAEAVSKVSYPGLDLSHLYQGKG